VGCHPGAANLHLADLFFFMPKMRTNGCHNDIYSCTFSCNALGLHFSHKLFVELQVTCRLPPWSSQPTLQPTVCTQPASCRSIFFLAQNVDQWATMIYITAHYKFSCNALGLHFPHKLFLQLWVICGLPPRAARCTIYSIQPYDYGALTVMV